LTNNSKNLISIGQTNNKEFYMRFSFKPLLMASILVGAFSGSVQASDTLPFSYKDVDDAHQNSTTLTYNGQQYTVEDCWGTSKTSEDLISNTLLSPLHYGSEDLRIFEDMSSLCPNHMNSYDVVDCGPNEQICDGHTVFSATLKLFVPVEEDESIDELAIIPTTVSNDEIETVEEVSSIVVVDTQPTPTQIFNMIMENVPMGYNLADAFRRILEHPENNEELAGAILSIQRQMNLNSKKLNK
jgi:hypothetical protein